MTTFCSSLSFCILQDELEDIAKPQYEGIEEALKIPGVEVRIFGKPTARKNRRMGVVLALTLEQAIEAANKIKVV